MLDRPCVACVGLIFFGVRALYSIDDHRLSPLYDAVIPSDKRVTGAVVTRACIGC